MRDSRLSVLRFLFSFFVFSALGGFVLSAVSSEPGNMLLTIVMRPLNQKEIGDIYKEQI